MTEPVPDRRSAPTEVLVEIARLKGLSDGVVAIALTLLVLEIRIHEGVAPSSLPGNLVVLAPSGVIYLIAFAIIGGAWGSHQRMLGQIGRGDGLLVWYTLLSLLPITLLPASASLLGDYPAEPVALAIFAANVVAIQITAALLWRHASRHGLITTGLDPRVVDGIGRRLGVIALSFALSILLALLTPVLVYVVWVAVFALVFTTDWLSWQQANRTVRATIPLDGAIGARITLRHRAGRLHVDAADSGAALVEGVFGGGLDQQVSIVDGHADLRLGVTRLGGLLSPRYPWAWGRLSQIDWDVGISGTVPIALTVEAADGSGLLELGALRLTALDLVARAGSLEVLLPSQGGALRVRVDSRSAAVDLRVPAGVAASIAVEPSSSGFVGVDSERFETVVAERQYRSPGIESAAARLEIETHVSSGAITVG